MEFIFSMNTCQFCVGHSHCEQCGEDLAQRLLRVAGIHRVSIDMKRRTMNIESSLAEDCLEEELEERGVFKL